MLHTSLALKATPILRQATMKGIGHQTLHCPVICLAVHYQQQDHQVEVLLTDELPYLLLLGHDVPTFHSLVQQAVQQLSEQEKDPEEERPSHRSQGPNPMDNLTPDWSLSPEFCRAQEQDPTLESLRQAIAMHEDQVTDEHAARWVPHILQKQGVLWWVATQNGQPGLVHKLIIPQLHRNQLLSQAHGHPWLGHQGHHKTLEWLLTQFFWPNIYEDT